MPGTVLSNGAATSNTTESPAFLEFICCVEKPTESSEHNETYIQHVTNQATEKTAVPGKGSKGVGTSHSNKQRF